MCMDARGAETEAAGFKAGPNQAAEFARECLIVQKGVEGEVVVADGACEYRFDAHHRWWGGVCATVAAALGLRLLLLLRSVCHRLN